MIAAQSWLLLGVFLSLGQMFSAALSWMGGPGELVILFLLIAAAFGLGAWVIEKEDLANIRAEERAAEPLPADGHPLTVYEQDVFAQIDAGLKSDQTKGSEQ